MLQMIPGRKKLHNIISFYYLLGAKKIKKTEQWNKPLSVQLQSKLQ